MACRSALLLLVVLAGCKPTVPEPPPLHALVLAPRTPSPRPPALVLVHGYGANERDLTSLVSRLDGRFEVHAVRAPLVLGPDSYAWFPLGGVTEIELAQRALGRYVRSLQTGKRSVFLLGFSQGAMLGLSLARTEPELLSGVVAIGGRLLPVTGEAKKGARPQVLIQHGARDGKVPPANAPQCKAALEALGRVVELRSYDAGHQITEEMLSDLAPWLTERLNETEAVPGG